MLPQFIPSMTFKTHPLPYFSHLSVIIQFGYHQPWLLHQWRATP
jgi:hypothetical protein